MNEGENDAEQPTSGACHCEPGRHSWTACPPNVTSYAKSPHRMRSGWKSFGCSPHLSNYIEASRRQKSPKSSKTTSEFSCCFLGGWMLKGHVFFWQTHPRVLPRLSADDDGCRKAAAAADDDDDDDENDEDSYLLQPEGECETGGRPAFYPFHPHMFYIVLSCFVIGPSKRSNGRERKSIG